MYEQKQSICWKHKIPSRMEIECLTIVIGCFITQII